MKAYLILFFLLFSSPLDAAIYGGDQRKDVSELSPKWQEISRAVAVALPTLFLEEEDKNYFFHSEKDERHYGKSVKLCRDEKFYHQKSFGHCTAFLIHPKLILTAGHCFLPAGSVENSPHSYCENFAFWLGYNDEKVTIPLLGSKIPKKDVVSCNKVVYATNNQEMEPELSPIDFALLELSEPVTHITPLQWTTRDFQFGEPLATIGHPHGLPAKFSGFSRVIDSAPTTFLANLDTLAGNSGGPTFSLKGKVAGILIAGHQNDTWYDHVAGCDRINRCDYNGNSCDAESGLHNSNLILKTEVWLPYIEKWLSENEG